MRKKNLPALVIALALSLLFNILPAAPALAVADIRVLPSTGKVGDSIEIYGSGFDLNSYDFYFARQSVALGDRIGTEVANYQFLGTKSIGSTGAFEGLFFIVPRELGNGVTVEKVHGGTYYIYATIRSAKPIMAKVAFTVQAVADITLNPVEATVGTEVKISGTGFNSNQSITIYFDGVQIKTATTDANGEFSNIPFNIPESVKGNHTVEARDATGRSASSTLATKQSMAVTPASGVPGDSLTFSGTGFAATSNVIITFDNVQVATATTTGAGSFSGVTYVLAAKAAGTYAVKATDANSNSDSKNFSIGTVAVNLSVTSGLSGSSVTVTGSGFRVGQPVTITFNNATVATVNSDNTGAVSKDIVVPELAAGTYKVKVTDGTNSAEADFTIATSGSISPTTGNVGDQLTVSGGGFTPGGTATITYDGSQVATASVAADGTFSATFNAPKSPGGNHPVVASQGVNSKQYTFVMETTPPAAPNLLKPETGVKAVAQTVFDWGDVSDPSGVTYTLQVATDEEFSQGSIVLNKPGLTKSQYTLTAKEKLEAAGKDKPYYWRVAAVDGASNTGPWSSIDSFYVGGGFSLGGSVLTSILIAAGAIVLLGLAFWLGRKTAYF